MGNISTSATVDGHPVYFLFTSWKNSVSSVFSTLLWPITSLATYYRLPLSLEIERSVPLLPASSRRSILETLDSDHHSLKNSIAHIQASLDKLEEREKALGLQMTEVECIRCFRAELLAKHESGAVGHVIDDKALAKLKNDLGETIPKLNDEVQRNLIILRAERLRLEKRFASLETSQADLTANITFIRDLEEETVSKELASVVDGDVAVDCDAEYLDH